MEGTDADEFAPLLLEHHVLTHHIDDVGTLLDGLDRAGMKARAAQERGGGKRSTILTVPMGTSPRPLPECAHS